MARGLRLLPGVLTAELRGERWPLQADCASWCNVEGTAPVSPAGVHAGGASGRSNVACGRRSRTQCHPVGLVDVHLRRKVAPAANGRRYSAPGGIRSQSVAVHAYASSFAFSLSSGVLLRACYFAMVCVELQVFRSYFHLTFSLRRVTVRPGAADFPCNIAA